MLMNYDKSQRLARRSADLLPTIDDAMSVLRRMNDREIVSAPNTPLPNPPPLVDPSLAALAAQMRWLRLNANQRGMTTLVVPASRGVSTQPIVQCLAQLLRQIDEGPILVIHCSSPVTGRASLGRPLDVASEEVEIVLNEPDSVAALDHVLSTSPASDLFSAWIGAGINRIRPTNPGQARAADQRAGVR